jgi:opine dehydrogenase
MPCGTFGGQGSAALIAAFERELPPVGPARAIDVSLSNLNHLIHPTVVLANLAQVDAGREVLFYRDGVTPAVGELLLAVDRDRLAVGAALGLSLRSVVELLRDFYRDMSGDTLTKMLRSFPAFATSLAPTSLEHRYVVDDVTYGLAGIEALAIRLGVPTPALSAVVTLLSVGAGADLRTGADELAAALFAAERLTQGYRSGAH